MWFINSPSTGMVDKKLTQAQPCDQLSGSGAVLACTKSRTYGPRGVHRISVLFSRPPRSKPRAHGHDDILWKERDMKTFINMLKDEAGASAAEYALILAIVGGAIALAALALGGAVSSSMNRASNCVTNTSTC